MNTIKVLLTELSLMWLSIEERELLSIIFTNVVTLFRKLDVSKHKMTDG